MTGLLVSILLSTAAGAVVGVRMLRLARRTRELPEIYVSIGLLGYVVGQLASLALAALGAHGNLLLEGSILAGYTIVQVALALFTVEVFGRCAWRWAALVAFVTPGVSMRLAILLQGGGLSGAAAQHQWMGATAVASVALVFGWMGVEALQYHRRARRACEIGLAGADVVNRFLVWGLGATASGILTFAVAVSSWVGMGGPTEAPNAQLITVAGLVNAVTWTLTFAPPAAYRRFVESRARERGTSSG